MFVVPTRGSAHFSDKIEDYPEGIVLPIDKPYRWTSADVVRKLKYAACRNFRKKNLKVGHAGTLDPLATGVLLLCIGKATRMAESLQSHDKEYIADIVFGATTPSYDLEKEIDAFYGVDGISAKAIQDALPGFMGDQLQVAPLFSAKSVDGKRAYEIARKIYRSGGDLDETAEGLLKRNRINISALELLEFFPSGSSAGQVAAAEGPSGRINVTDNSALGLPHARIRIACSKGTYIRAFARDLGEALGSGAHLGALTRTATGQFSLEDALSVEEATGLFA